MMLYVRLTNWQCTVCGLEENDVFGWAVPDCERCGEPMVRKYYAPAIIYKDDGYTGAQKDKEGRDG